MYISDYAINKKTDDLFNRSEFVKKIAYSITEFQTEESIAIGIFGPWGSGKSSLINLIIDEINQCSINLPKDKIPVIVWFNPWNFSDSNQILHAFFQQIYSSTNDFDKKSGEKIRKSLENLGKALDVFEKMPVIGNYFGVGNEIVKYFSNEKSLTKQKEELHCLFREFNRKFIIVIDDIDRLDNADIRQIFKTIKLIADFPNTVYLTAFDRKVVEAALDNEQGISGRAYLEKIIQVGLNIPKIEINELHQFLFTKIDELSKEFQHCDFEKERWNRIYNNGFGDLFTNMRDIKRYINSLRVTLSIVHEDVNFLDYLCIEALRVFLPSVYENVSNNRQLFLSDSTFWINVEKQKIETKKRLDQILNVDGIESENPAHGILINIFPHLQNIYPNIYHDNRTQKDFRKQKSVCSPIYFDNYFILKTPKSSLSEYEFSSFLSNLDNSDLTMENLEHYFKEKKFRTLFQKLADEIDLFTDQQKYALLNILPISIAHFPDISNELFELGSKLEQTYLFENILNSISENDRFNFFKEKIPKSDVLFPYAFVIRINIDHDSKNDPDNQNIFSTDKRALLANLIISRFHQMVKDYSLLMQFDSQYLLLFWKSWRKDDRYLKGFIQKIKKNQGLFLKMIKSFLFMQRSQTAGEYSMKTNKALNFKNLLEFFSYDDLETIIKKIKNNSQNQMEIEEEFAINLLIKNLENYQDTTKS